MHEIAYDMFSVLAASMIFSLVFLVLYALEKKKYLLYWAMSWFMYCTSVSFRFAEEMGADIHQADLIDISTNFFSTWLLLIGSLKFVRGTSTKTANYTLGIIYLIIFTIHLRTEEAKILHYMVYIMGAAIFVFSGVLLYRYTYRFSIGGKIAGITLILWGLHKADYPLIGDIVWVAPLSYQVAVILTLTTAAGIIMMHFEKSKKDIARRESFFGGLAEASRDIVFFVDYSPVPELKYISPSVEKITGYSQETVMDNDSLRNMIVMDFIRQEFVPKRKAELSPDKSHVHEIISRTGRKVLLSVSCTTYHGLDGSIDRIIGFAKDITEDILDFETLVDRQDWYEALFQKSYNMQMLVNAETGCIADANDAFIRFLGYTAEDLRATLFSELFADIRESEHFWASCHKLFEPARFKITDSRGYLKNVLISSSDIEFNNVKYLYLTFADLSSELHFEKELTNIATLHRAILESLNEGVIGLNEQGRIFFINSFAMKLLNYGYSEIVGRDHHDSIHYKNSKGELPKSRCPIMSAIKSDAQLLNHRDFFVKKSGEIFPVELTLGQLRYFNDERKCIIIFRDISSDLENESKMLQQIDENKVLLQEVHHRVKNNLQIISSLLSLQKDYMLDDSGKAKLNDSIARIKSMALIHELLYQTKGLSSLSLKQYLEKLVFDLHSMLAESDDIMIRTNIDDVFITLDYAVPYGLIVTELFTNAIKHAFKNATGEKLIEVGYIQADGHGRLWVRDTGAGIVTDLSDNKKSSFGMTVIHSLVKQIGGEISYENKGGLIVTVNISNPHTLS